MVSEGLWAGIMDISLSKYLAKLVMETTRVEGE